MKFEDFMNGFNDPQLRKFTENEKNNIISNSIQRCDWKTKTIILMEELSELGQEISKSCRLTEFEDPDDKFENEEKYKLLEEMADVLMGMEFLKMHYSLTGEEVEKALNVKYERERERIIKSRGL